MMSRLFLAAAILASWASGARADSPIIWGGGYAKDLTNLGVETNALRLDNGANHSDILPPAGVNTSLTLPATAGSSGFLLRTDGAGVLSWIAAPVTDWASPGPIGSGTPSSGAFTSLTANGISLPEGALPTYGVHFQESGNDTGFSSPSDGEIDFYANGTFAAALTPNGWGIKGVGYIWPGANAAGILTNNGSGSLSWSGVPWATPGAIGSTTPSTGAFTTLSANKIILPTGGPSTACLQFDSDTGLCSPGDGVMSFYANNVVQAQIQNGGITQIRGVDYSWPAAQAAAGNYVLLNDGFGALGWGALPLASPPPIGNGTPNTGAFTTVSANKFIAGVGDPSTTCYQFDNDTGLCSSGDGAMELWGNNTIGVRLDSNGIREIRGLSYLFPNGRGSPGDVLTDAAADGVLTWAPPVAGRLNYVETLDPAGDSSNRHTLKVNVEPSIPGGSITELDVEADASGSQPFDGLTTFVLRNNLSGSGDVINMTAIDASQTFGNGTDPVTITNGKFFTVSTNVLANMTLGSFEFMEWGLVVPGSSTVGNFTFMRDVSSIDHSTGSVSVFESRHNDGTIDGSITSFSDNNALGHVVGDIKPFSIANTWNTVDGNAYYYYAAPHILLANGSVTGYSDNSAVDNMPGTNSGYVGLNLGQNVATSGNSVGGFTTISSHPNIAGTVRTDFASWDDSPNVNHVARNVNYMNQHPNFTRVDDNYNGWGQNHHVTTMSSGSFTDANFSNKVDALAFNYRGLTINDQMTEASPVAADFTISVLGDVAGSLAGKGFTIAVPQVDGGQNYTPWFKVSGVGTPPGCCGNYIEVDISTGDSSTSNATALYSALVAYGPPLTTLMSFTDLGGSVQVVNTNAGAASLFNDQNSQFTASYATYGAGHGDAIGLDINMGSMSGFDADHVHGLRVSNGNVEISVNTPLKTEANVRSIHSIGTTFTAPASTTITGADNFGLGIAANLSLAHDAHVSSGAFGVGSMGMGGLILLQMDNASTQADMGGIFLASVPIGGSGSGGVLGTMHGYEFAGIPGFATGSPSLITNAKVFEARSPAGPFTTGNAWALWADSGFDQNFIGGALKIGSGGDTATAGYKLDVVGDVKVTGKEALTASSTDSGATGVFSTINTHVTADGSITSFGMQGLANAVVDSGATDDKLIAGGGFNGQRADGSDTGTLEELAGVNSITLHQPGSAGTTNKVVGVDVTNLMLAGNVTSLYDFRAVTVPGGATITNHYGLFLANSGVTAANEWGLYEETAAPNYLKGSLKIGSTSSFSSPSLAFEVEGNSRSIGSATANGFVAQGGSLDQPLTGTATLASSSSALVGTGTLFNSELTVGEAFYVAATAEVLYVTAIADDTNATVLLNSGDPTSTGFSDQILRHSTTPLFAGTAAGNPDGINSAFIDQGGRLSIDQNVGVGPGLRVAMGSNLYGSIGPAAVFLNGNVGIKNVAPAQTLTVDGNLGIADGSGNFHTIFEGGTQAADVTYTLPTAQASAGQVLRNDGTGALSWDSAPHSCTTRTAATGTATSSCNAGEIATGGGADCGNTALFLSKSVPNGGPPATGWTGSCTSLLNVVTNATIVVSAMCCAY